MAKATTPKISTPAPETVDGATQTDTTATDGAATDDETTDASNALDGAQEQPSADPNDGQETASAPEGTILMTHPAGGSCDRFEQDAAGNLIVPFEDIATMLDHGFVAVEG